MPRKYLSYVIGMAEGTESHGLLSLCFLESWSCVPKLGHASSVLVFNLPFDNRVLMIVYWNQHISIVMWVSVPSRLEEVLSFYLSPVQLGVSYTVSPLFCKLIEFGGEDRIKTKFWIGTIHLDDAFHNLQQICPYHKNQFHFFSPSNIGLQCCVYSLLNRFSVIRPWCSKNCSPFGIRPKVF